MEGDDRFYNREKLYKEVWEAPMTAVCKRYGVSDVALAKVCRKLNVPRPPVGYWAKKEAGKAPQQPELPAFDNPPKLYIYSPKEVEAQRKKQMEEWAREEAARKKKEYLVAQNEQRIINFGKGVEHWIQYREMAAFLEVVKESYRRTIDRNEDTGKWIQWAEKYLVNFQAIPKDLIQYDVEECQEKSTDPWQEIISRIREPPPEPYNYWKRPWYQR
jgi:hypothetical protein